MVQQQQSPSGAHLAGPMTNGPTSAAQTNGAPLDTSSSLAVPAIIATGGNPPHQSQYSPQANLYQQQIIKSAHQFAQQQQNRLNGLNGTSSNLIQQQQFQTNSQQNSPQTQPNQFNQSPQESFYGASASNGLQQPARPAPIYAPKPTYYGHIAQQQQSNPGQMYQTTRTMPQQPQPLQVAGGGGGYFQQQPSIAASSVGQAQTAISLNGGRQQVQTTTPQGAMPMLQNAPASASSVAQSALEQQQRQMQHLVMSYQQQQQQQEQQLQLQQMQLQLQQQQQQHQNSYLQQRQDQRLAPILSRPSEPNMSATLGGNFWPVSAEQVQQQVKSPPIFGSAYPTEQQGRQLHRRAPVSDRDSVSTLSRFNQLDERRSFTMRSQYTANAAGAVGKAGGRFGFVELAGEAFRQILGLGNQQSRASLIANEQLRQNMSLSASTVGVMSQAGLDQAQKFGTGHHQSGAKVTIIDSGDERQFKREVLAYKLAIMLLLNLLLSAFVLLSPVVMLLIPKMEPLIRGASQDGQGGSSLEYNAQEPSLAPSMSNVVTHAVGLAGPRQLGAKPVAGVLQQQQQQPQWRISECQSDCDGPLIGFFVRLLLLAVAHWAIFFRPQTATLPRIDFQRCLLVSLALLITTAFWLFFVFRVFDKRFNDFELHYMTIVQFANSMLETLISLHYMALALIEWRHRKRIYCLKVVRSPDGESKYYSCGLLSIQKCAQFVLEKYHRDFGQFDSYREQLLAFEDELAHHLKRQRQAQNGNDSPNETSAGHTATGRGRRSSRPSSPRRGGELDEREDNNDFGTDEEEARGERGTSRRSRRRSHRRHRRDHSSASRHSVDNDEDNDDEDGGGDDDDDELANSSSHRRKSPSRSPSRSTRRSHTARHGDVAIDSKHDEQRRRKRARGDRSSGDEEDGNHHHNNNNNNNNKDSEAISPAKQKRADTSKTTNESADQSSDTTSRMKESSLETVRAANVNQNNNSEQAGATAGTTNGNNNKLDIEISERPRHHQQTRSARDDTGSVRSGRSRRSTGSRMHQRGHRTESSSSRHHSSRRSAEHREQRSSSRARPHTAIEVEGSGPDEPSTASAAELLDEHERKLRRRKLRLLAAVEDSFEQVRLLDEGALDQTSDRGPTAQRLMAGGLDAGQLARSLYPSLARPLQKYLRLTKQTGRHNLQSIYEHLAKCLLYKLSARAFLEKFTKFDPVWQQQETNLFAGCRLFGPASGAKSRPAPDPQINSWSLICDTLLSRQIDSGTFFLLKQGQVSLLVSVAKLPHLSLSEQVIDQHSCRFTFGPNPETTSV